MDWILDHIDLLSTALIAVLSLVFSVIAQVKSSRTGARVDLLEDKNGNGIPDKIEDLIRINEELLKALKDEKANH